MAWPIAIADVEIASPLETIRGLNGYMGIRLLVRIDGRPIGSVSLPIIHGECTAAAQARAILHQLGNDLIHHRLVTLLAHPYEMDTWRGTDWISISHPVATTAQPAVTVAVCTRDRTDDLTRCLDALGQLQYPRLDLLVVDNAPATGDTERLLREHYPAVRYVREPRPGLDWARNRAIGEARGEIIAFTDDDVAVDPGWVSALAAVFADEPEVMAVTGLVWPLELETGAQVLFERYGGFGRGFRRRWFWSDPATPFPTAWLGTGQFGTGANMAFRRNVFETIGPFDPALDVGTQTNGGGDLEMFFRVLKAGHPLVYEPAALVRHRHRRDYRDLRYQLANNGVGLYSYLVRTALAHPDLRFAIARFGVRWFFRWSVRRLLISWILPTRFPRDLILAELVGSVKALPRYPRARLVAANLGPTEPNLSEADSLRTRSRPSTAVPLHPGIAVRQVELGAPLSAITDITSHGTTRLFVTINDRPIGSLDIINAYRPVSAARLREAIVARFGLALLRLDAAQPPDVHWAHTITALRNHWFSSTEGEPPAATLPSTIPVSIVIATYDRPDQLYRCLRSLERIESVREIEIIVVDNHPASGLTAPVARKFAGIVLIEESRGGLSYARNRGIAASTGNIVVATDDDVVVPPTWLEKLLAPFAQSDVMAVTGNTLPHQLDTNAQVLFEEYGGLGRGFERRTFDQAWFERFRRTAVPTWNIGATANAAFRAEIFADPAIGLLDESLGAGTPTGCSEDTYLFYKLLCAGHTIIYEPSAYLWHSHRTGARSLQQQIYNYSKGHVAYHLTTLINDGDVRALPYLIFHLPKLRVRQILSGIKRSVRHGNRNKPGTSSWRLLWVEVKGNVAGPYTLWRSRSRVARNSRSDPYVAPHYRAAAEHHAPTSGERQAGDTSKRPNAQNELAPGIQGVR